MSILNSLIPSFNRVNIRRHQSETAEDNGAFIAPVYEAKETAEAYGLTVHLPGVTKEGLELTAEDGLFTIRGTRAWQQPAGWTALYRESVEANFKLALTHDNTIDVDKIHAELKDGVLRVSLPKTEAVKPRKIVVA
jgi:HSP20 family molecular chaperone IbpA